MNPFWMVVADLRKHFLSGLGILLLLAAAFSINTAALLFERGLTDSSARAASDFDLVIGSPGSRLDLVLATVFLRTEETLPLLDYAVAERIASDTRVAASSPFVLADNYLGLPIVGVGPRFPELRPSLVPASGSWPSEDFQAIVGAEVPLTVGDRFESGHGLAGGAEGHHTETLYRVVGKLALTGTPWDRALLTPFGGIWKIHGYAGPHGISAILVKPVDFPAAYALRAEYRGATTTSAFPGEVLATAFGLFQDARKAVSALGLLLQFLVLAAVVFSLLASLPSKYRWIGLLRSLGAPRLYIFLTLWIQAAAVFVLAGGVGLVVGRAGAGLLASLVGAGTGLKVALSWSLSDLYPLTLFLAVAFAGALIPALVGYRVPVRRSILGQ